jgi:hypothetical protein
MIDNREREIAERIADCLKDLMRPEWISVSERLPEEDKPESILLYLDYRDGYGGQAVGYFLGGEFWLYEDGNIPCSKAEVDVIYWMPLPEAPEDAPLPP